MVDDKSPNEPTYFLVQKTRYKLRFNRQLTMKKQIKNETQKQNLLLLISGSG